MNIFTKQLIFTPSIQKFCINNGKKSQALIFNGQTLDISIKQTTTKIKQLT